MRNYDKTQRRVLIYGFLALLPITGLVVYEIIWWYIHRDAAGSLELADRDFPSLLITLLVVLVLPSLSVICGVFLAGNRKSRIAGIIMVSMAVILVICSVLFRPC